MSRYELLREAYSIIDGVPERAVNLSWWTHSIAVGRVDVHRCGTIGCAAGILSAHPLMRSLGLSLSEDTGEPSFKGRRAFGALAHLFDLSVDEAEELFGSPFIKSLDKGAPASLSHKALWLYRVRAFLRSKGEPVAIKEPA